MSSAVLPLKQLSTAAQCCLTSLRTPFSTHSSLPFKPDRFFYRSCSSSSQFPSRISLKKKDLGFLFTPCIAQTSDWARQGEEEEEIEEKSIDLAWENQQTSDDTEARGSKDDWEESQESSTDGAAQNEGNTEEYSEPPEEAKLFVGNIPYDIDSEGLAKVFEPAGFVEIAEVIYTRGTGQSRGFGFVSMSTVEEAEKAVEMFHRYELGGRLLTVNKAAPRGTQPERPARTFEPSYKIYVGNIPWDCDDSQLGEVFSKYGTVLSSRVVYDRESNRSRGFGFVAMSTEEEMNNAVGALDGKDFGGRAMRVSVAEDRPRAGSLF